MTNTLQNFVSDSPCGTHIIITTSGPNGKWHNWDWVISDEDLCDHTDWTRRDLRTVTDEMIKSVEFPDGVEGFFIPDDLDF